MKPNDGCMASQTHNHWNHLTTRMMQNPSSVSTKVPPKHSLAGPLVASYNGFMGRALLLSGQTLSTKEGTLIRLQFPATSRENSPKTSLLGRFSSREPPRPGWAKSPNQNRPAMGRPFLGLRRRFWAASRAHLHLQRDPRLPTPGTRRRRRRPERRGSDRSELFLSFFFRAFP